MPVSSKAAISVKVPPISAARRKRCEGELSRGIELKRFLIFRAPNVAGQQGFFPYRYPNLIGKFPAAWQSAAQVASRRDCYAAGSVCSEGDVFAFWVNARSSTACDRRAAE